MKKPILFVYILLTTILTGCIEIIDDLSFNADGSGTFKYSINLSSSKIKINSILALDSLDGKKVPTQDEIRTKIDEFQRKLMSQEGISGVEIESDFTNYMFKLKCDFSSASDLQTALKNVASNFAEGKNLEELKHNWITWDNATLSRSIPELTIDQTKKVKPEDIELLKQGSYTSITRFAVEVEKFDNPKAVMSKNKMAVMIKSDTYSLMEQTSILDNRIYLKK